MERRILHARLSRRLFIACGLWLVALGLYFVFLRAAFLPEDLRYIGVSLGQLQSMPGLERWLHRVFTVTGGFMAGAGMLTILAARQAPLVQGQRTRVGLLLTGLLTVGTMSLTNLQLDSDFKWLLLVPSLLWLTGLALAYSAGRGD